MMMMRCTCPACMGDTDTYHEEINTSIPTIDDVGDELCEYCHASVCLGDVSTDHCKPAYMRLIKDLYE